MTTIDPRSLIVGFLLATVAALASATAYKTEGGMRYQLLVEEGAPWLLDTSSGDVYRRNSYVDKKWKWIPAPSLEK